MIEFAVKIRKTKRSHSQEIQKTNDRHVKEKNYQSRKSKIRKTKIWKSRKKIDR